MSTTKRTIGLDLGDCWHHACVLDLDGEVLAEEVIANTREVSGTYFARYRGALVNMETGAHSPWVLLLARSLAHPVIVANARKLRLISQSRTKSDREGAQMPARLGRADPRRQSRMSRRNRFRAVSSRRVPAPLRHSLRSL